METSILKYHHYVIIFLELVIIALVGLLMFYGRKDYQAISAKLDKQDQHLVMMGGALSALVQDLEKIIKGPSM